MIGGIFIIIFYLAFVLIDSRQKKTQPVYSTKLLSAPNIEETDIIYNGATDTIGRSVIEAILEKHCTYYKSLQPELKEKFLQRTQKFMKHKIFIIKNNEGYQEMPVLVSAAAIQLSFGLKDYLLPFYKYIRVYPHEYLSDNFFKVLAGNVQNNVITVAWNQFLKGNEILTDGSNVGLHEMSHALYFQKMVIGSYAAKEFCKSYNHVLCACKEAHQSEINGQKNLYSAYADSELQEFWAESVEIFFEKPIELNEQYPSVYQAMKSLLKQDPLNKVYPVINEESTLSQKLVSIIGYSKS
jgi:MtfA peptidase